MGQSLVGNEESGMLRGNDVTIEIRRERERLSAIFNGALGGRSGGRAADLLSGRGTDDEVKTEDAG